MGQEIDRKEDKEMIVKPGVLQNIFGSDQSHKQFKDFHDDARQQYSEKLKAAPKIERNKKNYFLLPILKKLNHKIGGKISLNDYGFN